MMDFLVFLHTQYTFAALRCQYIFYAGMESTNSFEKVLEYLTLMNMTFFHLNALSEVARFDGIIGNSYYDLLLHYHVN